MITLSEAIKDGESAVDALTQKDFEEEIQHTEKMFDLFYRTFKFIVKHQDDILTEHDYVKWSILLLFVRNLRILRCAYRSMLNGYYDVSIAMQRMAFENHLLMYFFLLREKEAKKWWLGKRFSPRFLKKEVRDSLPYDEVYGILSESVHANFKMISFFSKEKGKDLEIWITKYDSTHFYRTLHGFLLFGVATLMIMIPTAFKEKFREEPLVKDIQEFVSLTKHLLKDTSKRVLEKREN